MSSVSIFRPSDLKMYPAGSKFNLSELGALQRPDPQEKNISARAWEMVMNVPPPDDDQPPEDVLALAEQRLAARARKDFAESDRLREIFS